MSKKNSSVYVVMRNGKLLALFDNAEDADECESEEVGSRTVEELVVHSNYNKEIEAEITGKDLDEDEGEDDDDGFIGLPDNDDRDPYGD